MIYEKCFFIPARSGSKGLVNKNISMLNNKMLFEWSFLAANSILGEKDCIIISTNCNIIKNWFHSNCNKFKNVYLRDRPIDLCGDKSSTESALIDSLEYMKLNNNYIENFILLQPTSPFRLDGIISKCLNYFYDNGKKRSVFTGSKHTPFLWKNCGGFFSPIYEIGDRKMRQDIRSEDFYYHEDGNIYVFSADNLLYKNNRLTDECIVVENSFINSIQIDSIEDFNMCVNIAKEERVLSWMNAL